MDAKGKEIILKNIKYLDEIKMSSDRYFNKIISSNKFDVTKIKKRAGYYKGLIEDLIDLTESDLSKV